MNFDFCLLLIFTRRPLVRYTMYIRGIGFMRTLRTVIVDHTTIVTPARPSVTQEYDTDRPYRSSIDGLTCENVPENNPRCHCSTSSRIRTAVVTLSLLRRRVY